VFFIQSVQSPELVLDVEGGNTVRGAKIIVWPRKAADYANQLFTFTPEGFIENVKSGLVLDIEGGGDAGAKVVIWDRKATKDAHNQRWQYDYNNQTFHSLHKNLVLDIEGGSRSHGAKVIAYYAKQSDNLNQRFNLIPASAAPAPVQAYAPAPVGYPAQPIPQPAYSPVYAAPSPVYAAPSPSFAAPSPSYAAPGAQLFYVQSSWNDLVLDIEGGSISAGAHVIMWPKKYGYDAQNQLFKFTPEGYIENPATGLVLDIKGGGGKGSHIIMWHKKAQHDARNQRFVFNSGTGTIVSKDGYVFDIEGGNRNQGAKVCVWNSKAQHENQNQRFRLVSQ